MAQFIDATGIAMADDLAISGILHVDNVQPNTTDTVGVAGNMSVTQNLSVGGNLTVTGNQILSGNVTVTGYLEADAGLKSDTLVSRTLGADLVLTGSGTGNVAVNDVLKVDSITAYTTNSNLSLGANGTGRVKINSGTDITGNVTVSLGATLGSELGMYQGAVKDGIIGITTGSGNYFTNSGVQSGQICIGHPDATGRVHLGINMTAGTDAPHITLGSTYMNVYSLANTFSSTYEGVYGNSAISTAGGIYASKSISAGTGFIGNSLTATGTNQSVTIAATGTGKINISNPVVVTGALTATSLNSDSLTAASGLATLALSGNGGAGVTIASGLTLPGTSSFIYQNSGLTYASTRPALVGGSVSANGEIRGYSSIGTTNDDGFLRLRAGGGTTTSVIAAIDISGYSTVPDMQSNIVMYTSGSEKLRITAAGVVAVTGTITTTSNVTVGGNLTVTGTISGSTTTTDGFMWLTANEACRSTGWTEQTFGTSGFYGIQTSGTGTFYVNWTLDRLNRTTSGKGMRVRAVTIMYYVSGAALTAADGTFSLITYANNSAPVATYPASTGTFTLTTSANPYMITNTITSPAYNNSANVGLAFSARFVCPASCVVFVTQARVDYDLNVI